MREYQMDTLLVVGAMTIVAILAFLRGRPAGTANPLVNPIEAGLPGVSATEAQEVAGHLSEIVAHLQSQNLGAVAELIGALVSRNPLRIAKAAAKLIASLRSNPSPAA